MAKFVVNASTEELAQLQYIKGAVEGLKILSTRVSNLSPKAATQMPGTTA